MTDFINLLMEMRGGAVAVDLNSKFNEMLAAVLETGGKGELTVKIKASPAKMGMGGAVLEVETEHECKVKKPELAIGRSVFFVNQEGNLTRNDPAQAAMFAAEPETKSTKENRN